MKVELPKYGAINRLALISVAMLAKPVTKAAIGIKRGARHLSSCVSWRKRPDRSTRQRTTPGKYSEAQNYPLCRLSRRLCRVPDHLHIIAGNLCYPQTTFWGPIRVRPDGTPPAVPRLRTMLGRSLFHIRSSAGFSSQC